MGGCLGKYEGDQTFTFFIVHCPGLSSAGRCPEPPSPTLSLLISPLFPLPLSQMEESLLGGNYDGGGGVCMCERDAGTTAHLTSWLMVGVASSRAAAH